MSIHKEMNPAPTSQQMDKFANALLEFCLMYEERTEEKLPPIAMMGLMAQAGIYAAALGFRRADFKRMAEICWDRGKREWQDRLNEQKSSSLPGLPR